MTVMEVFAGELEAKLDKVKVRAEAIVETAREEDRELTDDDQRRLDTLHAEAERLKGDHERATRDFGITDTARERITTARQQPVHYRSAGELLWDLLHARDDVDARDRVVRLQRAVDQSRQPVRLYRAAEHLGLDKANTVPTAGGFNGLVVAPNVGAVLDPSPVGAPLFGTLGPVPAAGATFQRPRIVDPNFDTGVAGGLQEKAEGPSKAWDILAEPLTLDVIRGYINVSELLLEMLAGSLDMVVGHMNRRLEWSLERAALVAVTDGAGTAIPLAADADAQAVMAAIAAAKAHVFRTTMQWPTWIAFGATGAERLMALTDAAGRPLFPNIGAANAPGVADGAGPPATVAGLSSVPTFAIDDADLYVGNGASLEAYLRRFPIMQALEPSLFGRQVGVAAAVTFYNPITTESPDGGTTPAEREGVAHIDWA